MFESSSVQGTYTMFLFWNQMDKIIFQSNYIHSDLVIVHQPEITSEMH